MNMDKHWSLLIHVHPWPVLFLPPGPAWPPAHRATLAVEQNAWQMDPGLGRCRAICAGGGRGGVARGRRHPAPPPRAAATAAAIAVAQNEVTLQGKIRPRHLASVGPAVSGFIEAFLVEPGADVYEGQVLARIGAQGLESAREVAQTALERAQEQVS